MKNYNEEELRSIIDNLPEWCQKRLLIYAEYLASTEDTAAMIPFENPEEK